MAKYKVVVAFTDLKDSNHVYSVGDEFPHTGSVVDDARINELSTNDNRRGEPLIVCTDPQGEPKTEKKPARRGRKPKAR